MAQSLVQSRPSAIIDANNYQMSTDELNVDCWLHILEYLSTEDLLAFCSVNKYFCEIIKSFIFPSKLFDFNVISKKFDTIDTFKKFGKQMRRIRISLVEFNRLLYLIIRNCEPNEITELHMEKIMHTNPANNERLLQQALPYFAKLHTFTFSGMELSRPFEKDFMKQLCSIPTLNLKVLTIRLHNLDREWTQSKSLQNLEEIHLKYSIMDDFNLVDFIQTKRQLKIFKYYNGIGFTSIDNAALKQCKRLEVFTYLSHPPYAQGIFELPPVKHFTTIVYDNGSDIQFWLGANQNTLETIDIISSEYNPYIAHPFTLVNLRASCSRWLRRFDEASFEKVTSVNIWITKKMNPEKLSDLMYILQFLSKLKNLKEVKITSWSITCNVFVILKYLAPGIKTISLENLEMKSFTYEMTVFALALSGFESRRDKQLKPIHLNINQQQLEYLQVNKIESYVRTLIFYRNITYFKYFFIPGSESQQSFYIFS